MNQQSLNAAEFLLAAKCVSSVALQTMDREHNYGDVSRGCEAVAAYLSRVAGPQGSRVILVGENSPFWVSAYLGSLYAGYVCVPLPETISPDEFAYVRELTDATTIVADASFALRRRSLLSGLHVVTDQEENQMEEARSHACFSQLISNSDRPGPASAQGNDLAALMFTSGSTGRPRGVMVSHRNIIANTESIIAYLGLTAADRMMTVLPFHYCFGTSLLHTHLRVGGSLVLDSRFMYPEVVLQRMIDTKCTGFAGVPSHFLVLLRRSSLRQKHFPDLRYVQQAGGPLAPASVAALREALPGTRIVIMYGQTEATARLSYLPPEFLDSKLGSIGRGIPGVTLHVVSDRGLPVQPGEVGEIVAEGDNITLGYWRCPEATQETFHDGKLYTGDLASVDSDGFIFIAGRSKDFLKCGGKRISCRQLEEQVMDCENVLEAAIVPMPDDILGDAVKLFVVPRDTRQNGIEAEIYRFCKERFPQSLVPKQIAILAGLPKNAAGKVMKERLKATALRTAAV